MQKLSQMEDLFSKKQQKNFQKTGLESKFVKVEKIPKKNWHLKKKNKIKKNY